MRYESERPYGSQAEFVNCDVLYLGNVFVNLWAVGSGKFAETLPRTVGARHPLASVKLILKYTGFAQSFDCLTRPLLAASKGLRKV